MSEKIKSTLKLIAKISVLLCILLVVIFNYNRLKTIDIRLLVDGKSLVLSAFIIVAVYLIKGVLFVIPAMLIYTSVGVAFSPVYAVAINLIGILAEVIVTYFLGKFLGEEYVRNLLLKNKGGQKILSRQIENKFLPLFVARALPIFPIDFLSLFLGSLSSNFLRYVLASFFGIAPRVVLFTILGEAIYDYIPTEKIIIIIAALLAISIISFVIRFFIKKRRSTSDESV